MPNLWPGNFGDLTVTPPLTLLREQANHLSQQSKGLLEGLVSTTKDGDNFVHSFYVVAPSLDNYTYLLFAVNHPVQLYPAQFFTDSAEPPLRSASPEQFQEHLKTVLNSERTLRVIRALLAQVGSPADGMAQGVAG